MTGIFEKARAADVRKDLGLPNDGRNALGDFGRLEEVFRDVMAPDVPTYDVTSTQGPGFDEWCYTESLCCFMAFTQSAEVNYRIAMEAEAADVPFIHDESVLERLSARMADKWADLSPCDATGRKVFFPPANNLHWLTNTDNVLRAFAMDDTWILKPHPITSDEDVRTAKIEFGFARIMPKSASGYAALMTADEIGYTTASEMGLVAMLQGKRAHDFTKFEFEGWGRLASIYNAIRRHDTGRNPLVAIKRILTHEASGIVPIWTPSEEAARRFAAFKARTIEIRDILRPVTRSLPRKPR